MAPRKRSRRNSKAGEETEKRQATKEAKIAADSSKNEETEGETEVSMENGGEGEGAAGLPQLTDKQKKLAALRLKANKARYLNKKEIQEEEKRGAMGPKASAYIPKKRIETREEVEKRLEEEKRSSSNLSTTSAERIAKLEANRAARLETRADDAEWQETKREKKRKRIAKSGREGTAFQSNIAFRSYKKRTREVPHDEEDYEMEKAMMTEQTFYPKADTLLLTQRASAKKNMSSRDKDRVELMAMEQRDFVQRREQLIIPNQKEGEAVDYINKRNMLFNQQAERAYSKYTAEIRQNLERGTAM